MAAPRERRTARFCIAAVVRPPRRRTHRVCVLCPCRCIPPRVRQSVDLWPALPLTLLAHAPGERQRQDEDLAQAGTLADLAADIADHTAKQGAQQGPGEDAPCQSLTVDVDKYTVPAGMRIGSEALVRHIMIQHQRYAHAKRARCAGRELPRRYDIDGWCARMRPTWRRARTVCHARRIAPARHDRPKLGPRDRLGTGSNCSTEYHVPQSQSGGRPRRRIASRLYAENSIRG